MTEWRWKNDASSSYMKCDEIYAKGGSARFYNAWVTDIEGQNVSKYHTYKFYQDLFIKWLTTHMKIM